MEMYELLDVIRMQRHDFLNHLQVISGFLQLNKSERAKEYIDQISSDIQAQSAITRLETSELKAVLMMALHITTKHQVEFIYDINTRLENCSVAGEKLAKPVEKSIKLAIEYLLPQEVKDKRLYFSVTEKDGITFKIALPGQPVNVVKEIKNNLVLDQELLAQDIKVVPERSELYFTVSE